MGSVAEGDKRFSRIHVAFYEAIGDDALGKLVYRTDVTGQAKQFDIGGIALLVAPDVLPRLALDGLTNEQEQEWKRLRTKSYPIFPFGVGVLAMGNVELGELWPLFHREEAGRICAWLDPNRDVMVRCGDNCCIVRDESFRPEPPLWQKLPWPAD